MNKSHSHLTKVNEVNKSDLFPLESMFLDTSLWIIFHVIWALFVVRVEAKLINCPFSLLTLAGWLRTVNIGLSMADPLPNHVDNFNQAKLIRASARARPTSKGPTNPHPPSPPTHHHSHTTHPPPPTPPSHLPLTHLTMQLPSLANSRTTLHLSL